MTKPFLATSLAALALIAVLAGALPATAQEAGSSSPLAKVQDSRTRDLLLARLEFEELGLAMAGTTDIAGQPAVMIRHRNDRDEIIYPQGAVIGGFKIVAIQPDYAVFERNGAQLWLARDSNLKATPSVRIAGQRVAAATSPQQSNAAKRTQSSSTPRISKSSEDLVVASSPAELSLPALPIRSERISFVATPGKLIEITDDLPQAQPSRPAVKRSKTFKTRIRSMIDVVLAPIVPDRRHKPAIEPAIEVQPPRIAPPTKKSERVKTIVAKADLVSTVERADPISQSSEPKKQVAIVRGVRSFISVLSTPFKRRAPRVKDKTSNYETAKVLRDVPEVDRFAASPAGRLSQSSLDIASADGPLFILPVQGRVTSGFGYRKSPMGGGRKYHKGVDIAGEPRSPVRAARAGRVVKVARNWNRGRYIVIQHDRGFSTQYFHLARTRVKEGDWVSQGAIIGQEGDSGETTGYHLHFEILVNGQAVDPRLYLPAIARR